MEIIKRKNTPGVYNINICNKTAYVITDRHEYKNGILKDEKERYSVTDNIALYKTSNDFDECINIVSSWMQTDFRYTKNFFQIF